ncbi:MAG: hypothetical protein JXA42_26915 [Anaerolineales bacterium]|nr:hypothetical protein [Anaerolineales bacterium]
MSLTLNVFIVFSVLTAIGLVGNYLYIGPRYGKKTRNNNTTLLLLFFLYSILFFCFDKMLFYLYSIGAVFFTIISYYIFGRKLKGHRLKILMDLGYGYRTRLMIVYGILCFMYSFIFLYEFLDFTLPNMEDLARGIFHLCAGVAFTLVGFNKNFVTQHGFYTPLRSVDWDNIQTYHWEFKDKYLLKLELKKLFLSRRIEIDVDTKQKEAVQALLEEYTSCLI